MKRPTLIDLFCGAGGLSHGFAQVGFSVLAGVDFDADSVSTFQANHPMSKVFHADLSELSPQQLGKQLGIQPGELDCLAGGPPCQGFSKNRAFRHVDGVFIDDPRNHLYWHFFDHVAYFQPKVVVIENVPEMLIKTNGYFHQAVLDRFVSLGYAAEAKVINASEYGVPQWRRRAFFLAGRDGVKVPFPEPTTLPGRRAGHRTPQSLDYVGMDERATTLSFFDTLPTSPTVWDAIGDLHNSYAKEFNAFCEYKSEPVTIYQAEQRSATNHVANHFPWKLTERQLNRVKLLREGQGQAHLPQELQTKNGYGSAYRRMQSDAQALTITTWMFHPGSGMFTHPFDNRVVTIREAARIQSFHDDFVFFGKYHSQCRQVGNSVAPRVAKSIGVAVLESLTCSVDHDFFSIRTMR